MTARQTLFLRREQDDRHDLRSIEIEPGPDDTLQAVENAYAGNGREETTLPQLEFADWLKGRLEQHRSEGWQPVNLPQRQRSTQERQPTPEQMEAIQAYAAKHGRNWKSRPRADWANGRTEERHAGAAKRPWGGSAGT